KKGKKTAKGVSPTTVNHNLRAARTFFNFCEHRVRRWLAHNPWEGIDLLPERTRRRLITEQELAALVEHAGEDFGELLTVMRLGGMGPGEVRLLDWDFIRWAEHRIVFPPEVIKTKVERSVTMLPKVEEVLRARAARLAREGKSAKGLVFLTAKGRPWTDVALSDRFAKLRKKCVKLNLIAEENAGERLVAYS